MVAPASPQPDPIVAAMREHSPAGAMTELRLAAVLDQSIDNPGKLIRARLVLAAAMTHGMDEDRALQLACAVEFYHIASLLLDDLPCMDDAETRRGLPCVHRVHGEAPTILASLALINRAYALVGFALVEQPMAVRLAAMACLDACLGVPGLVGGQARDLAFAESDRSAREIGRIAAAKTGALFWLAVYFPALIAQPDAEEGRLLKALCLYWGLGFQALDDLGDAGVAGAADSRGKPPGATKRLRGPTWFTCSASKPPRAVFAVCSRRRSGRSMRSCCGVRLGVTFQRFTAIFSRRMPVGSHLVSRLLRRRQPRPSRSDRRPCASFPLYS